MASLRSYRGNVHAPDFPPDMEWLNTEEPLSLADLRGKLVLLDFWTYGCINCMHVIPDLKRLEAEFPAVLVVIGVHSAKFANEGELENLRQVIARYELEHPIVNDKDFRLWDAYAVRAWPTTILIDPRGYVIAAHSGEAVYEAYHERIEEAVEEYEAQGVLDRTPLTFARQRGPETALSFPGKVLADAEGGRLFIADSNHHRIVITDLAGRVLQVIGSGARGLVDGSFREARFAKPQGMALDGDVLYVADTENHALRAAHLAEETVRTVAGNGVQGRGRVGPSPEETSLNSPWDLVLAHGNLYIAMAGLHQLWRFDLAGGEIGPYAGSGREGLLDAPLHRAALAQPSGITTDGDVLYFADSEASAVRMADLDPTGEVTTLIGEGLFEFGDVDGEWPRARLQHALGIVYHRGRLYVADTYNHKIKTVDVERAAVLTFLGQGTPGWRDDGEDAQFYEPGGLSAAGGNLYVADTNNHVVRVVDLARRRARTLALRDPQGLLIARRGEEGAGGEIVHLPEQRVRPGAGRLRIDVHLPEGYKVNEAAPSRIAWEQIPPQLSMAAGGEQIDLQGKELPLEIEVTYQEGQGILVGGLSLYYCESAESACLIYRAALRLPLVVAPQAEESTARVEVHVAPVS